MQDFDTYLDLIADGKDGLEKWEEQMKNLIMGLGLDMTRPSAIVINANPFTTGHRYLVELAAKRSTTVLVFVIEGKPESGSMGNHENTGIEFSFQERFNMTQACLMDIGNVTVLPSGPYIISRNDYPTAFLKEKLSNASAHAILDSQVFCHICKALGIKMAFAGDEPRDELSEIHLNALRKECAKEGITLRVAERKRLEDKYISSALARIAIAHGDIDTLGAILPGPVYNQVTSI